MLAIVIEVDYAFFHCSKAYLRSRLWEPESWVLGEEQYQVSMSQYFADSEEELARLDGAFLFISALLRSYPAHYALLRPGRVVSCLVMTWLQVPSFHHPRCGNRCCIGPCSGEG
jgi:hypothetical protein